MSGQIVRTVITAGFIALGAVSLPAGPAAAQAEREGAPSAAAPDAQRGDVAPSPQGPGQPAQEGDNQATPSEPGLQGCPDQGRPLQLLV